MRLHWQGDTVSVELPVTPNMSVELTGSDGLEIEPKGKIKERVSQCFLYELAYGE